MKSCLVLGLGRFGQAVATELHRLGWEVLAVDENEDNVQQVADLVTHSIVGDAKDEIVLRSIGVRNFDCAIVAIAGYDIQDSILTTLTLKELGMKEVICRAKNDLHRKVLLRIGADRVITPERDMAIRLASSLSSTNLVDMFELSPDYSMVELGAPKPWHNKTMRDLDVRAAFGLNIVAVRDRDHIRINMSPSADYVIRPDDVLVIVGQNDDIAMVKRL